MSVPPPVADTQRLPFAGARNFRDLGGHVTTTGDTVRRGVVYRADALQKLTAQDMPAFHALGIRTIYDLRSEAERRHAPGPVPSVHLPIVGTEEGSVGPARLPDMTTEQGEERLRDIYVGILRYSAANIGTVLRGIADPDTSPVVFHCHGGKDRTGVVAAVLLLAVGVDRENVLDDYEVTSRYLLFAENQDSFSNLIAAGMSAEAAASVMGTPRWAMAAAVDAIDTVHGGIDTYLTGPAGMTDTDLAALRHRCLTVEPEGSIIS